MQSFFEFLKAGPNQISLTEDAGVGLIFDPAEVAMPSPSDKSKNAKIISKLLQQKGVIFPEYLGKKVIKLKFSRNNTTVTQSGLEFEPEPDKKGHTYLTYKAKDGRIVTLRDTGSVLMLGRGPRGNSNKGDTFEKKVGNDFVNYLAGGPETAEIKAVMDILGKGYTLVSVNPDAGKSCTKRPLTFNGPLMTAGNIKPPYENGAALTDVTITVQKGKGAPEDVYLSCKNTGKINFANIGVSTIITEQDIQANNIKGKGLKLLKAFCVKPDLFCRVFNEYVKGNGDKSKWIEKDITKELSKSPGFESFLKSGIGCGYIKVEPGHAIEMTPQLLDSMTKVSSAVIRYPIGTAKEVNIMVKLGLGRYKIRFRNKADAKMRPSHVTIERA